MFSTGHWVRVSVRVKQCVMKRRLPSGRGRKLTFITRTRYLTGGEKQREREKLGLRGGRKGGTVDVKGLGLGKCSC